MTNRERLQSLSDYEYSMLSVVNHVSTKPMYYMTSDDTIFEFTADNKDEVWKDAQLHEIKWLESESE
jgi:hypothetical protein